jgi:hypothetical protein
MSVSIDAATRCACTASWMITPTSVLRFSDRGSRVVGADEDTGAIHHQRLGVQREHGRLRAQRCVALHDFTLDLRVGPEFPQLDAHRQQRFCAACDSR